MARHCTACGRDLEQAGAGGGAGHGDCPGPRTLDPPRHCARCGDRLDVQVLPAGVRATCRRCDGIHPAHRGT